MTWPPPFFSRLIRYSINVSLFNLFSKYKKLIIQLYLFVFIHLKILLSSYVSPFPSRGEGNAPITNGYVIENLIDSCEMTCTPDSFIDFWNHKILRV